MIDLQKGKAIIAVESDEGCGSCVFAKMIDMDGTAGCNGEFACFKWNRSDGKAVVFKVVDYKGEPSEN